MTFVARTLAVCLFLLAVGCGRPQEQATGTRLHPRRAPFGIAVGGGSNDTRGGSDRSEAESDATKGDLKTYAYASTDGLAIAAEVTSVLAPAGGGTVHYEGYELLDDAAKLESMADHATKRLKGVHPSDRTLVRARKDGIAAYSLTAEYASLMHNLAQADANDDLGALNTAANQALALEGSGDELAGLYTALIADLQAWSRTYPQASAEALKKYGD